MKKLLLITCGFAIAAELEAQIIHVPADYPTIQQGINAANNGDTVLVSDGTYYEQIDFLGKKPLMVTSQFLLDSDTTHIVNTIIDGSQPSNPDSASVVYFTSGEDTTSVLCGFSITGGTGTTIVTPDSIWGTAREGGGIWISGSGAKIMNNIITKNRCDATLHPGVLCANGGGIATDFPFELHWIVVENNVIDSNCLVSDTVGANSGAGILINDNCRITGNVIKNNMSTLMVNTPYWSQGTGALVFGAPEYGLDIDAIIQDNLFLDNVNNSNNAYGGGMKVGGATLTCTNNQFMGNSLISSIGPTNAWGAGLEAFKLLPGSVISGNLFLDNYSVRVHAGMYIVTGTDTVLIENNYFVNNVAEINGGGCCISNHPAVLQNNVFRGNRAGQRGGAIYLEKNSALNVFHLATLINNSFFGNKAGQGGAIYSTGSHPVIINSIFWGDTAVTGKEIYCFSADIAEVAYSDINPGDVSGNFQDGGGNIYQDPLFNNTDLLTIPNTSPCINSGSGEYTCTCGYQLFCPGHDIIGMVRPQNGYVDMGAYEVLITAIERHLDPCTGNLKISPNPSNDLITIYTPAYAGNTCLSIFTASGEKVIEKLIQEPETHLDISALPQGIYFVRVQREKHIEIEKFIKI